MSKSRTGNWIPGPDLKASDPVKLPRRVEAVTAAKGEKLSVNTFISGETLEEQVPTGVSGHTVYFTPLLGL